MEKKSTYSILKLVLTIVVLASCTSAQLSHSFYSGTCSKAANIVWKVVSQAVRNETRMAASLLRLHFHDCFVNGCDGSLLLDDTSSFTGEKTATPNLNSVRGFEVIDAIKSQLESACPGVVSCADILALAAEASVVLLGGPSYAVQLGRRDSRTASQDEAATLPSPLFNVSQLTAAFQAKDLSVKDMVVLSGAHTIGSAQCFTFRNRLYNFNGGSGADSTMEASYASSLQSNCPKDSGDNQLSDLDTATPKRFDNQYFKNLKGNKGLLTSDQVLFSTNGSETVSLVNTYANSWATFYTDFKAAMVKMGNISPLTGTSGEIRKNCRVVNS